MGIIVTREQLYEEVWSVPITQLCEKYGLSDNGLRKACLRLGVPVPPRGYWAKREAGHRVGKPKLPPKARHAQVEFFPRPKIEPVVMDAADAAWLEARKAFEADPAHAVQVVMKPRRWHSAIAPLHEAFEKEAREVQAARRANDAYEKWPEWRKQSQPAPDTTAWFWYELRGQLMPATHRAAAVRLSLEQYGRGLAILNTLARAATRRGYEVTHDEKLGRLVVSGHGGRLELRMSEATTLHFRKVKRYGGEVENKRYRLPTGRLRIFIERGYNKGTTFEEDGKVLLEGRLNEVMFGIAQQVVKCREKRRQVEAIARREAVLAAERAAEESRRREEKRKAAAERARRNALVGEVRAWRRAAEIRAYVLARRAEVERSGGAGSVEFEQWEAWALGVAEGECSRSRQRD